MVDHSEDVLANTIAKDWQRLSAARSTWEGHWNQIAELLLPDFRNTFTAGNTVTPGEIKTQMQLDATPAIALDQFGAILDSLLTPRTTIWHKVAPAIVELKKNREVVLYLDEVTTTLFKYRYREQSNFASQNQMVYQMLGAFGTGIMFVDELTTKPGIRYKSISVGQIYIRENHQGLIDMVYRYFKMTARQAVTQFGTDGALPEVIVKDAEGANPDKEYDFIHRVQPRNDFDPSRLDARGKPWESVYITVTGQKKTISTGGYSSMPYIVSRYKQTVGETYGRSPAMLALPAIKTLMSQKRTLLKQGHRAVDPVILTNDDGVMDEVSLKPGAINRGGLNAQGKRMIDTLPVGRVDIGKEMMDDERAIINSAFLVHLFQILAETPRMTATEVIERTREKGILLAPTVGRQQSEYLGPMIQREIDVLSNQGLLPEMPAALREAEGEFEVVYDSPLSRAMRAEETSGFVRTFETILPIVNITGDPSLLDNFDTDTILRDVAENNAMPAKWLASEEQVVAKRQARAEAAAKEEQNQAAPGQAALLNAVAKGKTAGVTEEDLS